MKAPIRSDLFLMNFLIDYEKLIEIQASNNNSSEVKKSNNYSKIDNGDVKKRVINRKKIGI